jgi:hypothetical protein
MDVQYLNRPRIGSDSESGANDEIKVIPFKKRILQNPGSSPE